MKDCCWRYVRGGVVLIGQWLVGWVRSYVRPRVKGEYDACRDVDRHGLHVSVEHAWLLLRILAGMYSVWTPQGQRRQRCPWHVVLPSE